MGQNRTIHFHFKNSSSPEAELVEEDPLISPKNRIKKQYKGKAKHKVKGNTVLTTITIEIERGKYKILSESSGNYYIEELSDNKDKIVFPPQTDHFHHLKTKISAFEHKDEHIGDPDS